MYEVIFNITHVETNASYISLTCCFSFVRLVKAQSFLWAVGKQTPIGTTKRNAK